MKTTRMVAVFLIIVGIIALVYQGITYTTRERVLKIGPLEATAEKEKTIPLPPIIGGLMIAGGIVMLVVNLRK